ncbi:MAG: hypothetical protein GY847_25780, partial [Proteobacteria bacterium]|nr:hypothetical protein [Pseudomonadota bacterium]
MIQEPAEIEGVQVKATMDCGAAASVCDREVAFEVLEKGEAVFCSGAHKLLSLHAFGGVNIKIYDTYFAARVKACDTQFDQIFFIVNNRIHLVLLGLPALMSARCRLLTVEGRDLMPKKSSAMMLNLSKLDFSKTDARRERAAHGLNTLAYKLIEEGPVQTVQDTWEQLDFKEFGPQPICVLSGPTKPTAEAELPPLSEAQAFDSIHLESEPIPIPTTRAFESPMDQDELERGELAGILPFCPLPPPANIKWRVEPTPEQLCQTREIERRAFERNFDCCTQLLSSSDYDWERQFNPPIKATLSEFSAESSDEKLASPLPLYLMHENPWLTSTNVRHLWPNTRHRIRCNVISRVPTTERYFYAEQTKDSLLTIVDGIIDIRDSPQPYIVVENNTELEVILQNGDKLAKIFPIEFDPARFDFGDCGAKTRSVVNDSADSVMLLSCSVNPVAIANVVNKLSVCSRNRRMSETENGKKDQLPPPEEEGARQASVQNMEGVLQEEKVTSIPPWVGYGR